MGLWLNVAFVQTDDLARVERELTSLVAEVGRPVASDAERWAIAGVRGAPGWTVLRTVPNEMLIEGTAPLLPRLAARLGVAAFQYNVYDGDSHLLFETDAEGRVERSGYVGSDPTRHWGRDPPADRSSAQLRIIDPASAASAAEASMPDARVLGVIPSYRRPSTPPEGPRRAEIERMQGMLEKACAEKRVELLRWLAETHGDARADGSWSNHPSHVVRALAREGDRFLSIEGVIEQAITTVFGGENGDRCNDLREILVAHAPLPVEGFTLYADGL